MYCSKCGKEIEEDAVFCKHCGVRIAPEPETSTPDNCDCEKEEENSVLDSVDFENILRKTLQTVFSVVKWFFYLTLSLLVLLVFVPKFVNVPSDSLWYIVGCIAVVSIYPIYSICKNWNTVKKCWSFAGGTFSDFHKWLYKDEEEEEKKL